jgi:hypothetical protein
LAPFNDESSGDILKPIQISNHLDADLEEPQPEENKSQAKRKTKKKPSKKGKTTKRQEAE